ncbi:putative holin-like toxin [Listeria rocourtiae]|uniref:putative holin-like toxin n=1 Tax=Listeria rocourtiae TaxID=647910 RepID=UPI0003E8BF18|nr:putative holin-like toxin [Listeria rocourtiae]EUJ47767.1 hypothetical protein PROCOU_07623 [Listeria rocourtiae FSL F6-920]
MSVAETLQLAVGFGSLLISLIALVLHLLSLTTTTKITILTRARVDGYHYKLLSPSLTELLSRNHFDA